MLPGSFIVLWLQNGLGRSMCKTWKDHRGAGTSKGMFQEVLQGRHGHPFPEEESEGC